MVHQLFILLILLTLLAACGGAPAAPAAEPTSAPAANSPAAPAPAPTVTPGINVSQIAAVTIVAESAEGRMIRHAAGETLVPLEPQRIAALALTESLLAIGVQPAAVPEWDLAGAFADRLSGSASIGYGEAYNLESIAAAQPDLILLHTKPGSGIEQYELLAQIAPTVVVSDPEADTRQVVRDLGLVLGRASAAEAAIAALDAQSAAARTQLAELVGAAPVAVVNVRSDHYRLYGIKVGYTGPTIYGELGLTPAALVRKLAPEAQNTRISLEVLPELDAEHIFLLYEQADAARVAELQNMSLWQALPAVAAGNVYPITGDHWYTNEILSTERKIADILAAVAAPASARATRTVTHVLGSSEAPANPQRIAVLDNFALEAVLSLGLTPVGAVYNEQVAQQPFIQGRLDGVENLGEVGTPNLERLLALDPDLILTINVYDDFQQTYEQLSQIAPTVPVDFESSAQWKDVFTQFAAALGRDAEAQALLAAYDARTAAFRDAVGASLADTTVSIVRVYSDGSLRLYLRDSFSGVVLSDAGLSWPAAQPRSGFAEDISKERLDLADADALFLWTANDPEGEQAIADLQADPLWQQLEAVQNERVYAAPRYWIGSSILAANAIVDDLYAAFGLEPAR